MARHSAPASAIYNIGPDKRAYRKLADAPHGNTSLARQSRSQWAADNLTREQNLKILSAPDTGYGAGALFAFGRHGDFDDLLGVTVLALQCSHDIFSVHHR